ncbi:MAG: DUF86 domain-containing protein [Roseofilum sp. SBFL]|uniref:HepT-like ribonuclease domain-containing protein n=1 Tax=unclassified Roseofilum TaxID=2620099 RepID=UPI001B265FA2|nr:MULTISPECIES: DUF86 domain-containing protein [unclassified Roseofilum]MBP0015746.1 DUF86 domain-containing protein [Roseofilum sp. SID3]MBP0025798.1 DUF86 domain-containing protein [Roseofilum sp. SID2]MBP0037324.1 DUF86 domain-containing protein [Roseofilum sp. SID1]MBP0041302.1 DUF86 domain-containing protein [Roseofilum sp. SBFL]
MSGSPRDYLLHILDETHYILTTSQGLNKALFLENETLKRAFVRSLEIIGEATKNLSYDFRAQYSDVAWKQIAGMRDKLIHDYFGVNYDIVWDVVNSEIPRLDLAIKRILMDLEGDIH